jgi:hypothetical protein
VPNIFEGKTSNFHCLHISKWHDTLLYVWDTLSVFYCDYV